jgi:hypothetical protein
MKKVVAVIFPNLENKKIRIELDDALSPRTFKAILDNLPVKVNVNRWGDEIYTDQTPIVVDEEDNAKVEVNELDVAYWPEGRALCLFFGPTPISKGGKILAHSPVNVVGKIVDYSNKYEILKLIRGGTNAIIKE